MNNKPGSNTVSLIMILLLVVGLIGAMFLAGKRQEFRKGAYFAGTKVLLLPESVTANVGDNVPVQLWVDTDFVTGSTTEKAKVSSVDTQICYGDGLILEATDVSSLIDLNPEAFKVVEYTKNENKCLRMVVAAGNIQPANLKSGLVRVATIRFKASKSGSGVLSLDLTKTKVAGYNPNADATDPAIKIASATGANYVISGGATGEVPTLPPTSNYPYLSFKMSFLGIRPDAKCADGTKMPLTVTVRANDGTVKEYKNIVPKMLAVDGVRATYEVKLNLDGFNYRDNIAVFVKGPKSLQGKYGVDGQKKYYDKAGGELTGLTNDITTTKVFDFTGYPLLAGDVTGKDGVQDGQVDGLDFSYVKTEATKRTSVAEGGYLLSDLNGNCQMESQDVANLMISLSEKQGQLY